MTGLTRGIALSRGNRSRRSIRNLAGKLRLLCGLLLGSLVLLCPDAALQAQAPLVNKPAPLFVRTDLQGRRIDLKALRGKVILLNFWATWCGPCRVELPQFQAWQNQYGSAGLQVVTISMDDDEQPIRAAVRKLGLDLPVIHGDDKLGTLYGGILGLPVTFLIDRQGRLVERREGAANLPDLERKVQQLLGRH